MRVNLMRSLIVLATVNGASVAQAQQSSALTVEDMQSQCLIEGGQLRVALGQAQAQIIYLRKENAELRASAEKKQEPKK